MTWSQLSTRLSSLPNVLAGPILRRVERDAVSVWIACKRAYSHLVLDIVDPGGATVFSSEETATRRLGDRLHVALVTARAPAGVMLALGFVYRYNIRFEEGQDLASPGILSDSDGIDKIRYGTHNLPSFVLPAADPGDLILVQGSCRKPHGGKSDALRGLDAILTATHDTPQRPQQLILTGDQIYADDVANALLFMLMDAGETLLGWTEELPSGASLTSSQLAPGARQWPMTSANLTSGHAKSHLVRLAEFYAMYLFAWSPELWPQTDSDWPRFDDVHPEIPTHREGYDVTSRRARTAEYEAFLSEVPALKEFLATLPAVRRALANIPSYMMFDDHEVTDDWFLTKEWCDQTLASGSLSRRIMQNALSAFAVFQAWGNTPERFETSDAPLSRLEALDGSSSADTWNNLGDMILPDVAPSGTSYKLTGGFEWHFAIDFGGHQLVAFDTRTRRGYASPTSAPKLIAESELPGQLPSAGAAALTVLLSPAPVFGNPFVEWHIQPAVETFSETAADFEAWSFDDREFQALLRELVDYRQVLILSGDVHFGFSASIEYWDERGSSVRPAAYAQLCSSALKNEGPKTDIASAIGILDEDDLAAFAMLAGRALGVHVGGPTTLLSIASGDLVRQLLSSDRIVDRPDCRYRITFAADERPEDERDVSAIVSGPAHARQRALRQYHQIADWDDDAEIVGHDNLGLISFEWTTEAQRATHELWYVPELDAVEELPEGATATDVQPRPLTRHVVELTVPSASSPLPGEGS